MLKVVAAILEKEDKVFIARRRPGKHLEGYWEFPGGKIENNETPEECLKRELKEELGIEITVKNYIGKSIYKYPQKTIELLCFSAFVKKGRIQLTEHDAYEWININDAFAFKLAHADIPLIELYKNRLNTDKDD